MATPIFSASQMAGLQKFMLRGMQTPVTIQRKVVASGAYGDDAVSFPTTVTTVNGWLFSKPTPTVQPDSGSIVTVNTYRLSLPVGTDILPGDQVLVGGDTYIVTDTTAESTWKASLHVSLRKRE